MTGSRPIITLPTRPGPMIDLHAIIFFATNGSVGDKRELIPTRLAGRTMCPRLPRPERGLE
jgi:hypothetical protein